MITIFSIHLSTKLLDPGNCGCFGDLIPMTPLEALVKNIITLIENYLSDFNLIKIEYISIRDLENFEIVDEINSDFVILIAVYVGKIRLIDNIIYRKK